MTDHKSIAAALSAFQAEMPVVGKAKTANAGTYKYAYADLADIVTACSPVLAKHGLAFTCQPRSENGTLLLGGTLLHTSGESIAGDLPIFGRTPQEIGSSLTYARRYLIGCLTGVVTDDDDDAQAANNARAAEAKDWGPILDALPMVTDLDTLKAMYVQEGVANAPAYVVAKFTAARSDLFAASLVAPADDNT